MQDLSVKIDVMIKGIARAEGFYKPDSLPARIHNPGDLEIGDRGYGVQAGKTCFPDDRTGWNWLHGEGTLMLSSMQTRHRSRIYTLDMTWLQVADHWTGHDNPEAWAEIVSAACGAQPFNTLQEYVDS
jgi:hypothetical protein